MAQRRVQMSVDFDQVELRKRNRVVESSILKEKPTEWDVFLDDPIKNESGSVANQELLQKITSYLKLIACIFTLIIILVCGVISKGTLLFMTSQLNPSQVIQYCNKDLDREKQYIVQNLSETEKVSWIWVTIIAFSIPEFITFFKSWITFWKNRFKHANSTADEKDKKNEKEDGEENDDQNKNNQKQNDDEMFSKIILIFVIAIETLHVFGLALLIFYIFPELDVVQCAMLTNCVCLIPSIFNLLSTIMELRRVTANWKSTVKMIFDIFAIIAQLTAFFVWPLVEISKPKLWAIPVALFFISLHYWENFLNPIETMASLDGLKNIKKNLDVLRYTYYKYVSLLKIICFFLMAMLINNYNGVNIETFFKVHEGFSAHDINITEVKPLELSRNTKDFSRLIPTGSIITLPAWETAPVYVLVINIFTTLICYIFGLFACKIRIQPISFGLPINITNCVTIILLLVLCGMRNNDPCSFHGSLPPYIFFYSPPVYSILDYVTTSFSWIWFFWILSQTWITLHIWSNSRQRMAKSDKLFVLPMYEALLIDQSLSLNRRQFEIKDTEQQSTPKDNLVTRIFVCATMWHETKDEMIEFLKSIFRMDEDQCARRLARQYFQTDDPDYYEFETHIYFDDAFQLEKLSKDELKELIAEGRMPRWFVNDYVKDLIACMNTAAKEVHLIEVNLEPPEIYPTHYGGRLVWTLPGNTKMIVHLKDKDKIRHKKRWSQVMYMYYLLGYKLMGDDDIGTTDDKQIRAENTYLLALDGDIDFQPNAVLLLVDLMKNNDDLGAACGRIHPIGSGPMVWYQMFEYAIGHWLQKATEDIIGCVLCSPGCFSLFRAEALMGQKVMKKYTTVSKEARHYVQYDQGEDRWLCTLMLQSGFGVKYCSASDAYTHCPEGFNEFYNQRRRWVPSTMANIMDLLEDSARTIKNNRNISHLYIYYQYLLMAGTILGPGTIFLMLVGAFVAAFPIDNWTSFFYNLVPILLYMFICFTCKQKIQLFAAGLISAAYGLIMMAVLVGIMLQIKNDGVLAPSSIFLFMVAGIMIVTAILHPIEIKCLPCGIIYYVTVPSMYLLLIIYSIFNLNDVSWGTREVTKSAEMMELEKKIKEGNKAPTANKPPTANENSPPKVVNNSWLSFLQTGNTDKNDKGSIEFSLAGLFKCMLFPHKKVDEGKTELIKITETLASMNKKLDAIERGSDCYVGRRASSSSLSQFPQGREYQPPSLGTLDELEETSSVNDGSTLVNLVVEAPKEEQRDQLVNPHWIDDIKDTFEEHCGTIAPVKIMSTKEHTFWKDLIKKYLKPLDNKNKETQDKVKSELKDLRDKCVMVFFMLNALFVLIVFLLTLKKKDLHIDWPFGIKVNVTFAADAQEIMLNKEYLQLEPIGFVFVIFFGIIMCVQFFAMLGHRIETFSHILAAAELNFFRTPQVKKRKSGNVAYKRHGLKIARSWQRLKDYKVRGNQNQAITGRRNTVRVINNRILEEKQRKKIIYLEQAFMENYNEFVKNPNIALLNMLPTTERRKTMQSCDGMVRNKRSENGQLPNRNETEFFEFESPA